MNELPVGLVRRAHENDITMLRGMYVDPAYHRRGIGAALLAHFVEALRGAECYCIPFSHLTHFYGAQKFHVVPDSGAPHFLRDRARHYRATGHDVLIMRRPCI